MLRLFFALQPAPTQSVDIVEQAAPLISQLQAQRVPPENLHATLCFIGAVPEDRLDALIDAAARVRGEKTMLCFDALEHWRRPRVICATSTEGPATSAARELSTKLAQATSAAGFSPDVKPFRAHLTLARKVDARRAAQLEWPVPLASAIPMHCDRFVLMRSDRSESGSIYSVVASWPLDIS